MTDKEILVHTKKENCFAIIIRHSDKEQADKKPIDLMLTEIGKKKATDFGSKISTNKEIRLFYSFVKRCEETADCIGKGYAGEVVQKKDEKILAGHYLFDAKRVFAEADKVDKYSFMANWFEGMYNEQYLMNAYTARQMMIDTIVSNYNPKFLDIYVTHDWNVTLLYSMHYNIKKKKYPWPEFMHGVSFFINDGKFSIMCEAEKYIGLDF